ncbi:protein kinase domain-containing protein [Nonomuraea roseoviolacea]|uniref:non-specific serine/threonine protein kinase n=1 Tax=Nonomuraea roseoviolacea subsp. carminata TaxID=160689 RepID=A0ABT1K0N3_9ACTN|nr:WD40 repeat domain-containing serine/threonine protein kinase [Nonomuraea roseoviolacea]MCP2346579.1 WD40 repeat protein [Nonomuraea roseoviolacea subsp. carminata]
MEALIAGDPQHIGEYWLAGRLGSGGQGVVYDAYDRDGRRVALKMLHAADNEAGRDRFAKEVAAAGRVASFCTARVLASDLSGSRPYIVSEYVAGPTLRQAVDRGRRFTGDDLHRLATAIATALTAVHDAGVIHRDLKPDNVLLDADGPRVIDFGIARTLDMSLTKTGEVSGTPSYMAPEVFTGQRAGAPADVFAWGSIMVFASTGQDPFRADNLGGVMHRVLSAQPDLSGLPPRLASLVAAAMEKDPSARPTARDLLLALVSGNAADTRGLLTAGSRAARGVYVPDAADPALGTIAEDAYGALAPDERELAAEVFLRMVAVTDDGYEAVRWALKEELLAGRSEREAQAIERILQVFSYLVTQKDDAVALSRPALLRAWPRLRVWVDGDRDGLAVLSQISSAARQWADNGRKDGDLLQGSRLDHALTWAATGRRHITLTPQERDFLAAGTELTRRRIRRRRLTTIALAGLLAVALAAGGLAVLQGRQVAEQSAVVARQRDQAVGRQVAAEADRWRTTDPVKAMLLSVAGWRLAPDTDTRRSLTTSLTMPESAVFRDPGAKGVSATAAAADGRTRVIAGEDGVRVYDVPSRRQTAFWKWPSGFAALPTAAALSPSGRTLVIVSRNRAYSWDTMTGRKLHEHDVSEDSPGVHVVFDAHESLVAVMRESTLEYLWNTRTGRSYAPSPMLESDSAAPAIAASGAYVAGIGVNQGGLKVIRLSDLTVDTRMPKKCGTVVAFTPDSRRLLCANGDVEEWNLDTATKVTDEDRPFWQESASDDFVNGRLRVSRDGRRLLGVDGRTIHLWDAEKGGELYTYQAEGPLGDAWLDPAGRTIRYLLDSSIVTVDLGSRVSSSRLPDGYQVSAFSQDGRLIAATKDAHPMRVWDTHRLGAPMAGSEGAGSPLFDPAGRRLAAAGEDRAVSLWDVATGARRWRHPVPQGQFVLSRTFTPDGGELVLSLAEESERDARNELVVLAADTGRVLARHKLDTTTGTIVATRDGKAVVSNIGKVFDLSTGKVVGRGFNGAGEAIAVSPTAPLLALGAGTVELWDSAQGEERPPALRVANDAQVEAVLFSHDGALLALISRSIGETFDDVYTAQVWDVGSRQRLGSFPIEILDLLAFSADDHTLYVSGNSSGTVTAIPVDGNRVAELVCKRAGRTMSQEEWSQYLKGVSYRDVCPAS